MNEPSELRLGFISGRPCFEDEGLWTDAGTGRLIDALAERCDRLVVALSTSTRRRLIDDHRLSIDRERFVALPSMPSYARSLHRTSACLRAIAAIDASSDAVILQLPFTAPAALLRPGRPRVYHVCSDVKAMATSSTRYSGPLRIPAVVAAETIDRIQRFVIGRRDARIVTNGEALLDAYGRSRGRAVVSTTMRASEIDSVKRRRPMDAPFRILFVGFLRPEKGIEVLLEAYQRIRRELAAVELTLVTTPAYVDRGNAIRERLNQLAATAPIELLGTKPFGPELFQCFADADVLCVPSRSEGTPRVLIEARAFRCPVVATRVGGIPTSVTDGVDGLLVERDDVEGLTRAVLRLASDRALRERLIEGGLARARSATIDLFADAMLREVAIARQLIAPDRSVSPEHFEAS